MGAPTLIRRFLGAPEDPTIRAALDGEKAPPAAPPEEPSSPSAPADGAPELIRRYIPTPAERAKGLVYRAARGVAAAIGGNLEAAGTAGVPTALAFGAADAGGLSALRAQRDLIQQGQQTIGEPIAEVGRRVSASAEGLRPAKDVASGGLTGDVVEGIGSAGGFLATSILGGAAARLTGLAPQTAAYIGSLAAGVGGNFASGYQDAIESTGDKAAASWAADQARQAGGTAADAAIAYGTVLRDTADLDTAMFSGLLSGIIVGPTETLGIGDAARIASILSKVERASEGSLGAALAKTLVEESAQEGWSQFVTNVGAHLFQYDQDRSLWEGVAKSAAIGGLAGVFFGGPLEVAANLRAHPEAQQAAVEAGILPPEAVTAGPAETVRYERPSGTIEVTGSPEAQAEMERILREQENESPASAPVPPAGTEEQAAPPTAPAPAEEEGTAPAEPPPSGGFQAPGKSEEQRARDLGLTVEEYRRRAGKPEQPAPPTESAPAHEPQAEVQAAPETQPPQEGAGQPTIVITDLKGRPVRTIPAEGPLPPSAPPPRVPKKAPSDWTVIGRNPAGQLLYEDQRGVRSYIENGVRITEPVIVPPSGEVRPSRRDSPEWQLAEVHPAQKGKREPEVQTAPEPQPIHEPRAGPEHPARTFARAFEEGRDISTATKLRHFAQENRIDLAGKDLDEAVELGTVLRARRIVEEGRASGATDQEVFDRLLDLYQRQPKLEARTSTSKELQAYSTPAPIAWVASQLAGIREGTRVIEPTAGNGALLLGADLGKNVTANELDQRRIENLREVGFQKVTGKDAVTRDFQGEQAKAIVANPPFGKVHEGKKPRDFDVPLPPGKGRFKTREIDHAIALNVLNGLDRDGRAVLIIGGVKPFGANTPETRVQGYRPMERQRFFNALYSNYNVVRHVTLDGKLYDRQGAAWPIDVIEIHGRGRSTLVRPFAQAPRLLESWDEVRKLLAGDRLGAPGQQPEGDRGTPAVPPSVETPGAPGLPAPRGEPAGVDVGGPEQGGPGEAGRRPGPVEAGATRPGKGAQEPVAGVPPEPVPASESSPLGGGEVEQLSPAPTQERGPGSAPRTGEGRTPRVGEPALSESEPIRALERVTEHQATYRPASSGNQIGTLVPANMQVAVDRALARIAHKSGGSVDQFVAQKLGYPEAGLGNHFAAEQVDALAMAIDNIDNGAGFILGDQTGVGKGRVVAGLLRYARREGYVPVFVTASTGLYGDMMRDLADIGEEGFRPLVTNGDLTGKNAIPYGQGQTISTPRDQAAAFKEFVAAARKRRKPTGNYDGIFTTYDQLSPRAGGLHQRHTLMAAIAPRAFFVLDESHKAGGTEQGGWRGEAPKLTRAEWMRGLVDKAHAVAYSSATWAKNPHVMTLYTRTGLGEAFESREKLTDVIKAGGVPLQQVVSGMLAENGQMVRREKSFEGIRMGAEQAGVPRETAEVATDLLRRLFEFDLHVAQPLRDELIESTGAAGGGVGAGDAAVGAGAAQTTGFSGVMHNVVAQMLLALKAREVGRRAAELFHGTALDENGKPLPRQKPIVALSNTMESLLDTVMVEGGHHVGDFIPGFTFSKVFERYLRRMLMANVRSSETGQSELVPVPVPPAAQALYDDLLERIQSSDLDQLPASPIDAIIDEMQRAGLRVGEITGRSMRVEYHDEGDPIVRSRDNGQAARKKAMRAFNNGELDALVVNRSGSTGFSLHASPKNGTDVMPRHMLVVQNEPNIDDFMQMLGRINRTGQTALPSYTVLVADVPAEKRPAAVLMKKMASLNANTSAARTSAVSLQGAVDFLNEYGEKAALEVLASEPDILHTFGWDEQDVKSAIANGTLAKRLTGFMALLPIAEQERIYEQIESAYEARLEEAKAAGENALEAEVHDLEAKTIERVEFVAGRGRSPFTRTAYLERVEAKRTFEPISWAKMQERALKLMGAETNRDVDAASREKVQELTKRVDDALEAEMVVARRQASDLKARIDPAKGGKDTAAQALASLQNRFIKKQLLAEAIKERIRLLNNRSVLRESKDGLQATWIAGVVPPKRGNLLAPGGWTVHYVVQAWGRMNTISIARLMSSTAEDEAHVAFTPSPRTFGPEDFKGERLETREERYIVTGNPLLGLDATHGKGQIGFYTTAKGTQEQGIIMPRGWDPRVALEAEPVRLTPKQTVQFLDQVGGLVQDNKGLLRVATAGPGFPITISVDSKGGKPFYLLGAARAALGKDFESRRGEKEWVVETNDRAAVVRALEAYRDNLGTEFVTHENKDAARKLTGQNLPEFTKGSKTVALHGGVPPLPFGGGWLTPARMKDWYLRAFSHGHLDADTRRELERARGYIEAEMEEYRVRANDLQRVMQKKYGAGWEGKAEGARLKAALESQERMDELPEDERRPLLAMRAHLDRLSAAMIRTGAVTGELAETVAANMGSYVHRAYRAHRDAGWMHKVTPEVWQRARDVLATWEEFAGLSDDEIDAEMEAWLTDAAKNADNPWRHLTSGKLGRKDLSILKQRKDLPVELRDFLGEIRNPLAAYGQSVFKMAQLVGKHIGYTKIREAGEGVWMFDKPTPGGYVAKISAEGNRALAPLDGMYVRREVHEALTSITPSDSHALLKLFLKVNGWIKWGKVIGGGPYQMIRNLWGNVPIAIANGHAPSWVHPQEWKMAFGHGDLEERKFLIREGIIGDTVGAAEWTDLKKMAALSPDELVKRGESAWGSPVEIKRGFENAYTAMDDLPKIRGFYAEVELLKDAGYSPAEARRVAADHIRDLYPTFSRMWPVMKWWRRQPLLGGFLGFTSEMFRTTGARMRLIAEEVRSPNPKIRALGWRRAAGQLAALSLFPSAAIVANLLNGIDRDEDDDRREFVPDYDKESQIVWLGGPADGAYVDVSDLDPFSQFTDPFARILAGDDPTEVGSRWIEHQGETYLWPSPLTQILIDLYRGETQRGAPIDDTTAYVIKKAQPGLLDQLERASKSWAAFGHEVGTTLLGVRARPFDVDKEMGYAVARFVDSVSDITSRVHREIKKTPTRETEQAARAAADIRRAPLFADLAEKVRSAVRLGLRPERVYEILDKRLSRENASAVMTGAYIPMKPQPLTQPTRTGGIGTPQVSK